MIELHNGNCMDIMKDIPNESVDLIVTDPPYLHVKGGMKSKKFNTGTWKPESYMNQKMADFGKHEIFSMLDLCKLKCNKMNGYFFCSKLQLPFYFEWISLNKMKFDLLIWNKEKTSIKNTKFFTSDIDYVVKIYENGVSLNKILKEDGSKSDVSFYSKLQTFKQPKGNHETMKPLELIERYVLLSSKENDTVLDMFMGSGTTGVACVNTNRNFIGIELNKDYFEIAKERIENE